MEKRFVLFLILSLGVLVGYQLLMSVLYPHQADRPEIAQREDAPKGKPAAKPAEKGGPQIPAAKPAAKPGQKPAKPDEPRPKPGAQEKPGPAEAVIGPKEPPKPAPSEPEPAETWVTLGSADPQDPYRMLVTLTNRGAAVTAIELNSPRFRDFDDADGHKYDRSGYLGRVTLDEQVHGAGCPVQVVGPGTPAAAAGIKAGDLIKTVAGERVTNAFELGRELKRTRPGQTIDLTILRDGKELTVQVTLGERPLAVIRPEANDPYSFLMTLSRVDAQELGEDEAKADGQDEKPHVDLDAEIKGVSLRKGNWKIVSASPSQVTFLRKVPAWGLEVRKTYRLAQVPAEQAEDPDYKAYHLVLEIKIDNLDRAPHQVAYQLDGPNGLPIEGWWYSNKVSRTWSSVGVRDVAVSFGGATPKLVGCSHIAGDAVDSLPWKDPSLSFIGVDAQFFSAVLIPDNEVAGETWLAESRPIVVGDVDPERKQLANTSFRLTSQPYELAPDKDCAQRFVIFAGPKKPPLLEQYGLGEMVYYGWFSWVAKLLLVILHAFYALVRNYGLAIILLTVLVRLCMFPLSRKQTLNAIKMQELQPEIKRIQEKYKKDLEARTKAQQELFRKHNYNPLGGCLVMFIQLPIFVALYRLLMVDVELRQAPLLSESIRWCSNLAAPDMFLDWSGLMPAFVNSGVGWFGLGPYLNVLPIVTVFLFLWQQKKLMPPPADEQAAMQQNVMKYMMIFMGLLFYKVASGLCIYFIASSLWGLGERRFLPKHQTDSTGQSTDAARTKPTPRAGPNGDGTPPRKKKSRGKR